MKENTNKNYLKEELYDILSQNLTTNADDGYGNDYGETEACEMLWKAIEESDGDNIFEGNLKFGFKGFVNLDVDSREQVEYIIELIDYIELKGDRHA